MGLASFTALETPANRTTLRMWDWPHLQLWRPQLPRARVRSVSFRLSQPMAPYCGHKVLAVLSLPHMAHSARHTQPLLLQCGHCTVHILLLPAADDHVGPILGQTPGDGKANPVGRRGDGGDGFGPLRLVPRRTPMTTSVVSLTLPKSGFKIFNSRHFEYLLHARPSRSSYFIITALL